jgi:hypothetical protein
MTPKPGVCETGSSSIASFRAATPKVRNGSKCERLTASKSGPQLLQHPTSQRVLSTSLECQEATSCRPECLQHSMRGDGVTTDKTQAGLDALRRACARGGDRPGVAVMMRASESKDTRKQKAGVAPDFRVAACLHASRRAPSRRDSDQSNSYFPN